MLTGLEIGIGFKALKAAFDIAKEAKELTDSTAIKAKVIEMQSLILSAQESAIEAREAHSTQVDRIRSLEEEIARLRSWNEEKTRYELKEIGAATFAYMLRPAERGNEPPHWLCPSCFEDGKKSVFQRKTEMYTNAVCSRCAANIGPYKDPCWS